MNKAASSTLNISAISDANNANIMDYDYHHRNHSFITFSEDNAMPSIDDGTLSPSPDGIHIQEVVDDIPTNIHFNNFPSNTTFDDLHSDTTINIPEVTMQDLQKTTEVLLLKLSMRLSKDNQMLLVDLLRQINMAHVVESETAISSSNVAEAETLQYPTTFPDLRKQFIDGKDSLPTTISNILKIEKEVNTKTYFIPLQNLLQLHFTFEHEIHHHSKLSSTLWESKKGRMESERVRMLAQGRTHTHFLCLLWSDGFDT